MFREVLQGKSDQVIQARIDAANWAMKMEHETVNFRDITKQAHAANESLAKRVMEYDAKFAEMENRLALLGMKFGGK